MARRGSFERRLLLALALFSLIPSFALLGAGTYLLFEAVDLNTAPDTWENVRASGVELLDRAADVGDPELARAAAAHRAVLSESVQQSRRWEFLTQRVLQLIPAVAILLGAILVWMAVRFARGIAHEISRPINELTEWSGRIGRGEPLPAVGGERPQPGELAVLRDAFRTMASELEISREQALEAERHRSWVTMARGVAHELKNSLTPLRLAIRALERQTGDISAAREPLEVATAESARLEEMARNFSQFGHLPEGPGSEIDLREQLDYLLRSHLPPGVQHRLRAPVDLPRIHGNHDALSRAFANLLLNAVDAMGGGGSVSVKMTTVGEGVEVRILDSGPGIPPEILDRIWDPDFTTKTRGTGLGLALVRKTVQAHGGSVAARNRPEGGAEFRVVLPISAITNYA